MARNWDGCREGVWDGVMGNVCREDLYIYKAYESSGTALNHQMIVIFQIFYQHIERTFL